MSSLHPRPVQARSELKFSLRHSTGIRYPSPSSSSLPWFTPCPRESTQILQDSRLLYNLLLRNPT
ncbi:hypothetical protein PCASD_08168 [Puccinia coronata f. sp. avenae]|uniref:Uncharacterized protein n=1 Tax=Puccinia coronata f. sp. avenae TaxID=200324 RepID=A0A2N5VC58_9BASI|nr:hypothetical protein PCASD_08168 [Puccinia coronata f. sp. avenae]